MIYNYAIQILPYLCSVNKLQQLKTVWRTG
nr:MAG TPA: hypothetical protein [Caudoviricetes sp.]